MATPQFQIQTGNITFLASNPGSLFIPTKDTSGNPVNVSSGYTGVNLTPLPVSAANGGYPGFDLLSNMTVSFGSTGVTLSWTGAQANTISTLLPTVQTAGNLRVSNDSGTTDSIIGTIQMTMNQASLQS